ALGWIAAASQTPLGPRPWPIGSTDGSIWNVVFVFNGLDRLRGTATSQALTRDPPGALRLLRVAGPHYPTPGGTALNAAFTLGVAGAVVAVRRPVDRVALAGAVAFGVWLLVGVALLSHMQRLEPRYLETITPAIAAVAGAGLSSAARRRGVLIAAVAVAGGGAILLAHPPTWAVVVAVVAVAPTAATPGHA